MKYIISQLLFASMLFTYDASAKIILSEAVLLYGEVLPGYVSPKIGLERLQQGNDRFVKDQPLNPHRSSLRRIESAPLQRPFAVIMGCADSRIPPEIVFDQGIGDLFVVRVAGNVVGPLELESIEYSILVNHSSLIVVLGHENCGAVSAVFNKNADAIPAISHLIGPAIKGEKTIEEAVKANVRATIKVLENTVEFKPLILQEKIKIVGAYYELKTGKVQFLLP